MKYLKDFDQLNEGVTDKLYHFTHINNVITMMKTNKIHLSPVFGTHADYVINRGKLYAFSMTTSRHTGIGYASAQRRGGDFNNTVRLTMNGRALNQNFKSIPVDYWAGFDDVDGKVKGKPSIISDHPQRDEQEDRVISDKGVLKPATKYITMIEVINGSVELVSTLKKLADKRKIPFYAYDNVKYFDMSVKKYAIDVEELDANKFENHDITNSELGDVARIMAYILYRNDKQSKDIWKGLSQFDIDLKGLKERLAYEHERVHNSLAYINDWRASEAVTVLSNTIHNNKSNPNPVLRFIIGELGKDIKRGGFKTLKEYVLNKPWLGRKTNKDFNKQLWNRMEREFDIAYKKSLDDYLWGDFYLKNGEWIEKLSVYKPVLDFLQTKMKKFKDALKEKIMNNSDMYASTYAYGSSSLKELLGYDRDEKEEYRIPLKDVDNDKGFDEDLSGAVRSWLWHIETILSDEIQKIKDESQKQWRS